MRSAILLVLAMAAVVPTADAATRRHPARHPAHAPVRQAAQVAASQALPQNLRRELLDDFRHPADWQASASEQVQASLRTDRDGSLCLDYDFAGVSGYAVMRRTLAMNWPERFDLTARVKGSGTRNDLQFKLVDASGDNVWWLNRPALNLPATPTDLKIRSRQIGFAWGPASDRALKRTQALEFVVAAGREGGGKGSLCVARLALAERAADPPAWPEPRVTVRGRNVDFDYGRMREFNGLALRWPAGTRGLAYDLLASDDARDWRALRRVRGSDGGLDALFLPESEARYLRLQFKRNAPRPQLGLRSAAEWPDLNAVLASRAADAPRGDLPRAFVGEQNYWTLVGVDGGGGRSGLMSEDGALEVGRGGFSVEPSVQLDDGSRVTWAQATLTQSLRDGYLPVPGVHWQHAAFTLDIEAAADGPRDAPELLARYVLRNCSARTRSYTVMLAVRPWQVNPPQQFLATPGGASMLRWLAWDGSLLAVNGRPALRFADAPQRVSGLSYDGGASLAALQDGPALSVLGDPQGSASAGLQFRVTLAPGGSHVIAWAAPLGRRAGDGPATAASEIAARIDATAGLWRERLNRSRLEVPADARPLVDTLRSALAQILMSRDGPALQPGTRSYARSWVRDGAMMVAGLLRLGEVDAAREFVDWFSGYIFASGKVPCCVDARGADPVVENDSHGQYLYAVAEVWRHTHDRAFLQRHWPQVQRVTAWLEALRQAERGASHPGPGGARYAGLLPRSISHEGYSDQPAYSYWDDFWALRGYKDAVILARAMDEEAQAAAWARSRDAFERELTASITATAAHYQIDTIAGAADRGDFDATSTTVALDPAQFDRLPGMLAATFERYWHEMGARSEGRRAWKDYTPYELRTVGALVRLGQPERAHAMLGFFFKDQRPPGWNQWAEVVLPQLREVRFLGDMPHAWVSSDYIRSALDLFAYEREADEALVIGAGFKPEWLAQGAIQVQGLSTAYGRLGYRIARTAGGWVLDLAAEAGPAGATAMPPGAVRLVWPGKSPLPTALHEGRALAWQGRELPLPAAPATVQLTPLPAAATP